MEEVLESKLFIAIVGLLGAWIVGNALAIRWQLIRKRKELELGLSGDCQRTEVSSTGPP